MQVYTIVLLKNESSLKAVFDYCIRGRRSCTRSRSEGLALHQAGPSILGTSGTRSSRWYCRCLARVPPCRIHQAVCSAAVIELNQVVGNPIWLRSGLTCCTEHQTPDQPVARQASSQEDLLGYTAF